MSTLLGMHLTIQNHKPQVHHKGARPESQESNDATKCGEVAAIPTSEFSIMAPVLVYDVIIMLRFEATVPFSVLTLACMTLF